MEAGKIILADLGVNRYSNIIVDVINASYPKAAATEDIETISMESKFYDLKKCLEEDETKQIGFISIIFVDENMKNEKEKADVEALQAFKDF